MSSVIALHGSHAVVGKDFWTDATTGNWAEDCATGRFRAERYMIRLNQTPDAAPLFLHSMHEIMERGLWTGVEVGFFQRIMEMAMVGQDARK